MEKPTASMDSTPSGRSFDWQDILPWLIIIRALRPAVSFRLLVLSAIGLVAMVAGWRLFWNLLAESPSESRFVASQQFLGARNVDEYLRLQEDLSRPDWPWQTQRVAPDAESFPGVPLAEFDTRSIVEPIVQFSRPFRLLLHKGLTLTGLAFVLLCGVWTLAVWGYFGGMMTRTAALRLTIDEQVSWRKASSFARSRWSSYFGAPIFPLLGIVVAALPIALLGLMARADVGVLIAGIFWPLALVGGLFMTLLLVGLAFGWPLMWATISTEGTDAFDALGRAYAYVYQRPLHLLFYALVAVVTGTLGLLFVAAFAAVVIHCTEWAAGWGASGARIREVAGLGLESGVGYVGSSLILFWKHAVATLVAAFSIAYLWSASTAIYLLLRRSVDAAEVDEVELDEGDERYGMPPLEADEAGVAGTADGGSVAPD